METVAYLESREASRLVRGVRKPCKMLLPATQPLHLLAGTDLCCLGAWVWAEVRHQPDEPDCNVIGGWYVERCVIEHTDRLQRATAVERDCIRELLDTLSEVWSEYTADQIRDLVPNVDDRYATIRHERRYDVAPAEEEGVAS